MPAEAMSITATATLLAAVAGDPLRLAGEARDVIGRRCSTPDRAYVCLTHGVPLANGCQLAFHVYRGGAHVVARWCPRHGPEAWEPTPPPEVWHG